MAADSSPSFIVEVLEEDCRWNFQKELFKKKKKYIYIYIHTHPNQGMGAGTHLFHTDKQLCYLCLWIMAVEVTLMEQDGAHGHQTVPNSIRINFRALLERAFLGGLGPVSRGSVCILFTVAILWDPLVRGL